MTFGGNPATNIVALDATKLTAITPQHSVGVVDVTVTDSKGESEALECGYTYDTVTHLQTLAKTLTGGTSISASLPDLGGNETIIVTVQWGRNANVTLTGASGVSDFWIPRASLGEITKPNGESPGRVRSPQR